MSKQQRQFHITPIHNAQNASGRGMQWDLALVEMPMNYLMGKSYFDCSVENRDCYKRPWYNHHLQR